MDGKLFSSWLNILGVVCGLDLMQGTDQEYVSRDRPLGKCLLLIAPLAAQDCTIELRPANRRYADLSR
jgi:hypothetical protein